MLQLIHTNTFDKTYYSIIFLMCNRQNKEKSVFFWKSEKKDEFLIIVCIMRISGFKQRMSDDKN